MRFLGEEIPEWKVTHKFLQALNSNWDANVLTLQSQSDSKVITLEELIAKLQSQSNLTERRMDQRNYKNTESTALTTQRKMNSEESSMTTEKETSEIALLTKAIANLSKGRRNFSRGNRETQSGGGARYAEKKEDRVCYHCQRKGHLSKDCFKKKRGEPPAPKPHQAMFAVWEDSDQEGESEKPTKEPCLMAGSTCSEVTDKKSFESENIDESNLADAIASILTINEELKERISELEKELDDDIEENILWSTKAMKLEKEIREHVCKCNTCDEKEKQITKLRSEIEQMKIGSIKQIDLLSRVNEMENKEIKLKWKNHQAVEDSSSKNDEKEAELLHQPEARKIAEVKESYKRNFVRPGLGYETQKDPEGKRAVMDAGKRSQLEVTLARRQTRRKASTSEGSFVSDKDSVPHKARTAYRIWQKQNMSDKPSKIMFQTKKKRTASSPRQSSEICWHCGRSGHSRSNCSKLIKSYRKNSNWKTSQNLQSKFRQWKDYRTKDRITSPRPIPPSRPRMTPRKKIDLDNHNLFSYTYSVPAENFFSKPSKPKLVWVRKN